MSIWSKIGDFVTSVPTPGRWIESAIDIAKADDSEDLTTKQILQRNLNYEPAARGVGKVAGLPGIAQALYGLQTGYQYGVARPISTTAQQLTAIEGNDVSPVFGSKAWREAWNQSRTVSPGQALTTLFEDSNNAVTGGPAKPFGLQGDRWSGSDWTKVASMGERGSENFDPAFSFASGSVDAFLNWTADPLVVAGKGAKAARVAAREAKPSDLAAIAAPDPSILKGRDAKVRSGFDRFIEETDDYSASQLADMSAFKESSQGAALASVFAQASGNHEVKRLIWRTALGDDAAKTALQAQRGDLTAQIDRMTGDLDDRLFAQELAGPNGTIASLNDPAEIAALQAEIKASSRQIDFFDRILPDWEAAQRAADANTPLTGDALGVYGATGSRARITKADRRKAEKYSSFTVQDGVGGIPTRVMRAPVNKRPEGWIDLHDADSAFSETKLMLNRVRNLDPIERQKMLDSVIAAPDDNARSLVIQGVENKVFRHVGEELGYTPDEVESILRKTRLEQRSAVGTYKERAYGAASDETGLPVDVMRLEDGTLLRRPLMETQLANSMPTLDIDNVYRVLKQNQNRIGAMRAVDATWYLGEHTLDTVNDLWKFSVLVRGGYLVRNVIDSNIRLMSYLDGAQYATSVAENAGVGLRKILGRKPDHFGQGEVKVGEYKTSDAFGRTEDEYQFNRKHVSSQESWLSLARSRSAESGNAMRGSGDFRMVHGEDPNYVEDYLRLTNQHLRMSEISQRLLAGESPEQVARWLRSPEGRSLRRRMVHRADTPEQLVAAVDQNLNHLVPRPEMRAVLKERAFTAEDVETLFGKNQLGRPPINAEQMLYSMGRGPIAERYDKIRDGYFKWFNSLPDDVVGRHPMYRQMYRGRVQQLLKQADPSLSGRLNAAEQRVLEEQSRIWARREMKRYMFDVSSKSDLAQFVRFLSPFFSAWEDTMVKYGRLIARNPALIPRAWDVWTAPNDASIFEVVDADGNPVSGKKAGINDDQYIRIQAGFLGPKFSQATMDVSKSGFNTVLQGDPWWLPGFGPMVQAPVNEVAKSRPQLEDSVKFILPFGTSDQGPLSLKAFLPTAVKTASVGEEDAKYSRVMVMIAQTERANYALGKRDTKPTADEIKKRTDAYWKLRTFTSLLSPASIQYKSPYQFYIDESHRFQEKYGLDADKKFLEKYGEDYFLFATSMSENKTGVRASQQADAAGRKVKDLIAKFPEYGWFFVGPDNTGEFSRNVYTAQQLRKVGPDSTDVWRGSHTPQEALAKNNAELGWLEYQKMAARLEAVRIQRGLPSMAVKGAEDLRAIKSEWLAKVSDPKAGPTWGQDWLNDYEERDAGKVRKFLTAAKAAIADPRINERKDIVTMNDYLYARSKIRDVLQQRKAQGGSANIAAKENGDIASVWAEVTGFLVDQDITFADVFRRVLESDDLLAAV